MADVGGALAFRVTVVLGDLRGLGWLMQDGDVYGNLELLTRFSRTLPTERNAGKRRRFLR